MTPDPCGVDEGLTLADAADRMRANDIRHLLVIKGGKLMGVVGSADLTLAAAISEDSARKTPIRGATRRALLCLPGTPIAVAARAMEASHYECAVIVDEGANVVGIFTLTDALRALRELSTGREADREITPSHVVEVAQEREQALPSVRVKRMLKAHRAAPSPNDGTALGKVFS